VIVVGPGAVATPIWDKADSVDVSQYANTPYVQSLTAVKNFMLETGRKGFPPEKLGEVVHKALTVAKPKTRYTVTPEPFMNFLMLNLPKRMVDNMVAGRLGLKRT
jgi:short-subunit dehydrogenase